MTHIESASEILEKPLNYGAVIEGILQDAFPEAWSKTYYYDPARNRTPYQEADFISKAFEPYIQNGSRRGLQNYRNDLEQIIRKGRGKLVPFQQTKAQLCYLMGESPELDKPNRLREFFNETTLQKWPVSLLARLFDDFVLRHETGHSINHCDHFVRPVPIGVRQERLCDSFSILSMAQDFGDLVFPFGEAVAKARIFQDTPVYDTSGQITETLDHIRNIGLPTVSSLDTKELYAIALRISSDAPVTPLTPAP